MVDGLLLYGCCRWTGRVQRGATSLAYWGIFSDTEYCGSENSLISYGIFRWQISVRLQAYPLLHLQPSLFRWLHHPPCGLDLPFLFYRFCRLGQGLTAQVVVQVLVFTIVQRLVKQAFPELRP